MFIEIKTKGQKNPKDSNVYRKIKTKGQMNPKDSNVYKIGKITFDPVGVVKK